MAFVNPGAAFSFVRFGPGQKGPATFSCLRFHELAPAKRELTARGTPSPTPPKARPTPPPPTTTTTALQEEEEEEPWTISIVRYFSRRRQGSLRSAKRLLLAEGRQAGSEEGLQAETLFFSSFFLPCLFSRAKQG
jgi:hypothetical protein